MLATILRWVRSLVPTYLDSAGDKDFHTILQFTLQWEGGFVDHPNDPGGKTNRGVTQSTYDRYRNDKGLPLKDVRHIGDQEVRTIYYRMFWKKAGCDNLPPLLAMATFDWAVHSGPNRPLPYLEAIAREVHPKHESVLYWVPLRQNTDDYELAVNLVGKRNCYLQRLIRDNEDLRVFRRGWENRIKSLYKFLSDEKSRRSD